MKACIYTRVAEVKHKGQTVKALIPDDRWSADRFAKAKPGRMVMVQVHTPRNGKQHRMIWALCQMIADNVDRFANAEHVMREIKVNTGHVERVQINVPGLGIVFQEWPASISYESMKQDEFALWFEKALAYVGEAIWPGMAPDTIREEIALMLGLQDDGRAAA